MEILFHLFSLFMRYCLKNEQECIIRFQNSRRNCEFFLNGFNLSDIDQLILPLMDLRLFSSKKLDVKLSRVFIKHEDKTVKHKDTH